MPRKSAQDPAQAGEGAVKKTRRGAAIAPFTLTVDMPEDLRLEVEKVAAALGVRTSVVSAHLQSSVEAHLKSHQGKLGQTMLAAHQAALAQAGLATTAPQEPAP
jgi:hypothetical protein